MSSPKPRHPLGSGIDRDLRTGRRELAATLKLQNRLLRAAIKARNGEEAEKLSHSVGKTLGFLLRIDRALA